MRSSANRPISRPAARSRYVMQEKTEAAMAFVLNRGEYDQRKDQVTPDTPAMLPPFPADLPRNRLGFAKWLLRPEHPLTARVTVNRFWQEVFGTGLVRTAGDFGVTGELPSHPELLDWLAVEFREAGWDVKKFFKLMVTSATYRQARSSRRRSSRRIRENRLLSRGPRFRMDAEMVRDYALAASGLLVRQDRRAEREAVSAAGVWEAVAMIGSNTRDYKQDTGENLYRRSMYTFWKRAAPPASMDIFNAPNRETCTVRRERTNTPLQALVTLNDPQFVEAARHLAERAIAGERRRRRADRLPRRALAGPPVAAPRSWRSCAVRSQKFEQHYAAARGRREEADRRRRIESRRRTLPPPQLAAWTMVANELMNLDEVLNK